MAKNQQEQYPAFRPRRVLLSLNRSHHHITSLVVQALTSVCCYLSFNERRLTLNSDYTTTHQFCRVHYSGHLTLVVATLTLALTMACDEGLRKILVSIRHGPKMHDQSCNSQEEVLSHRAFLHRCPNRRLTYPDCLHLQSKA